VLRRCEVDRHPVGRRASAAKRPSLPDWLRAWRADDLRDRDPAGATGARLIDARAPRRTALRHTSAEFVAFLTDIVAKQPRGKEIHVIAHILSAHKTQQVDAFLAEHPLVPMHFTPTYSSWLNQVELWFAKVERDVIARGVFTSVPDLKRKPMRYIRKYDEQPKPVKWKYFDPTRRITPDPIVTAHWNESRQPVEAAIAHARPITPALCTLGVARHRAHRPGWRSGPQPDDRVRGARWPRTHSRSCPGPGHCFNIEHRLIWCNLHEALLLTKGAGRASAQVAALPPPGPGGRASMGAACVEHRTRQALIHRRRGSDVNSSASRRIGTGRRTPRDLARVARAPPTGRRAHSSTKTTSQILRSASCPNNNGPSPCDEEPLNGLCRCYLGWLMGYKTAT
jgi:transposase